MTLDSCAYKQVEFTKSKMSREENCKTTKALTSKIQFI